MVFEDGGKIQQSSFETSLKSKDSMFSNAQRLSTILTTMLETGIVNFLGINFIDKKNEKDSDEKLSSDVSTGMVDAVAGQSPYGFKRVN
jgi:hypothetical protein